jgi:hypothetical protein
MNAKEATERALAAGATLDMIQREYEVALKRHGTVPQRNMIRALQMCTWHNTADDWARLAGGLKAQRARR